MRATMRIRMPPPLSAVLFLLTTTLVVVAAFVVPTTTPTRRSNNHLHHVMADPNAFYSDDEWHPRDPAESTPQLLEGIWHQIAQAGSMQKGESMTVLYPEMEGQMNSPRYLNLLLGHLDVCKDVCDHFGISTTLVPYQQQNKIVGFTAKSFKNTENSKKNKEEDFEFDYDPFWDDGTDFEKLYDGIDDEDMAKDPYPKIEIEVPDDDEEIIQITKTWVGKMMSDMGICPFTSGPDKAGLPIGDVFYCVDRHAEPEDMYEKYWGEVVRVEKNKEKDLSTTLLIIPEFFLDNVELFETFCNTLTQPLTALNVEDLLQLVFFHPHWSFRDGNARATASGLAANYARRSPWPMINLLRTKQVRAAQKGIPTGLVYKQNEKTLNGIGVDQLETMLRLRDWSAIKDEKVNRREFDALKIAQDYQQTGKIAKKDLSLAQDATPAANKVDLSQIENGNLVNVLEQALSKRLDERQPLTGPETTAAAMTVEFLLQELDTVIAEKGAAPTAVVEQEAAPPVVVEEEEPVVVEDDSDAAMEAARERARQERMAAARKAMLDDLTGASEQPSEPEESRFGQSSENILFGKGGIPDSRQDDDTIQEGMDPGSFY